MKTWFTSDWHLGDDRFGIQNLTGKPNTFYRDFNTKDEQDKTISRNLTKSDFVDGDELYHLGDVLYLTADDSLRYMQIVRDTFPKSRFNLIIGNYDDDKLDILGNYFDTMQKSWIVDIKDREYDLNHYPAKCIDKEFSITGHVHGLWKVQKNMINVGVDAWHFKPVSEDEIDFCRTACEKYYDKNVFPY